MYFNKGNNYKNNRTKTYIQRLPLCDDHVKMILVTKKENVL